MRLCTKCGSPGKFYRDATRPDGIHSICAKCHKDSTTKRMATDPGARIKQRNTSRRWRLANPEESRRAIVNATLKAKYGITLVRYEAMLDEQNGGCAVCKSKPEKQRLHVDHDHATGKVRALLCQACNVSIGKMKDSPELLRKLAAYIEEHNH